MKNTHQFCLSSLQTVNGMNHSKKYNVFVKSGEFQPNLQNIMQKSQSDSYQLTQPINERRFKSASAE